MSSMYVFTPKRGCPICHVLLTVQNTHRRALLFIDNRQFTGQTKPSSIYRHKPYWALKKRRALLTIQAKLKLAISFFFYFSVAKTLAILASAWLEEENFEVLKRCHIQIYPTLRRSESDGLDSLRRMANARNVSFRISLRWPINIFEVPNVRVGRYF